MAHQERVIEMSAILNILHALRDECGPADTERQQRLEQAITNITNGSVADLVGLPPLHAASVAA